MAVLIDLECSGCGRKFIDEPLSRENETHCAKGVLVWAPALTQTGSKFCSEAEKVAVYVSDKENNVAYPMRNDRAMPKHLKGRGYERRELTPNQLGSFEKRHNVVSQIRHFDRNGRGLDG